MRTNRAKFLVAHRPDTLWIKVVTEGHNKVRFGLGASPEVHGCCCLSDGSGGLPPVLCILCVLCVLCIVCILVHIVCIVCIVYVKEIEDLSSKL